MHWGIGVFKKSVLIAVNVDLVFYWLVTYYIILSNLGVKIDSYFKAFLKYYVYQCTYSEILVLTGYWYKQ